MAPATPALPTQTALRSDVVRGGLTLAAGLCLTLTALLLWDLLQVQVYRHDAMYYLQQQAFFDKLVAEGRWINYYLFPLLRQIPGGLAAVVSLLCWGLFAYLSARRWVQSSLLALCIASLAMQISPLMNQLQWPATILPAFLLLGLAPLAAARIPALLFFPVFGVLMFGSFSYIYYLLPLLYLRWLDSDDLAANMKRLCLQLLPLWALGFVVGYLSSLLAVYLASGAFGMEIESWRQPHYIESPGDVAANVQRAFGYFTEHLSALFPDGLHVVAGAAAATLCLLGNRSPRYIALGTLALAIICVHYVLTVPLGIIISFRTASPMWLGWIALLFFTPLRLRWQALGLLACLLLFTTSLYLQNRDTLRWYATVTTTFTGQLRAASPKPPESYQGAVFLSSDTAVAEAISAIESRYGLKPLPEMESLARAARWVPAAREAGFRKVWLCETEEKRARPLCTRILEGAPASPARCQSGLYRVNGESKGFLLVEMNPPECLQNGIDP
ncbi:hypothetical protein FV139_17825 [Parahaliea maris]|uniref:Glucosyl transferase GtrII n=1 Tax=Parahaliea maris TaxID=2716870 RepID=A0A5C8ZSU7_9GAMM|nr:hypothetical protein [Parahaliea maris]TXS90829.1 hypothetical protein FV139_17825 [Parahaliea maris]